MWSGSTSSIPSGWVLCNGSNGTPDLRDRFIVGAGNAYSVGNTGGANSVTISWSQMPSHSHSYSGGDRQTVGNGGQSQPVSQGGNNTGSAGGNGAHENRPPYYALAYIMKT